MPGPGSLFLYLRATGETKKPTQANLIYVGYRLTPAGVPSPCGGLSGGSDEVDIFSHFVDILTVGNLDVDIVT
jgi:hypothetical protein